MIDYNSIEYFENFDKTIRVSEYESILLKRLSDNTVMISYLDILTGTTTKLAFYNSGKWLGYNPVNLNKLFALFKVNKVLKPNLIRFLTPNEHIVEIKKIERVVVCFKKRFHITIKKTKRNLDNLDILNKFT
jgi:hypothetical protein